MDTTASWSQMFHQWHCPIWRQTLCNLPKETTLLSRVYIQDFEGPVSHLTLLTQNGFQIKSLHAHGQGQTTKSTPAPNVANVLPTFPTESDTWRSTRDWSHSPALSAGSVLPASHTSPSTSEFTRARNPSSVRCAGSSSSTSHIWSYTTEPTQGKNLLCAGTAANVLHRKPTLSIIREFTLAGRPDSFLGELKGSVHLKSLSTMPIENLHSPLLFMVPIPARCGCSCLHLLKESQLSCMLASREICLSPTLPSI